MNGKRKLLLVSSGVFSLLLSGLTLLAVKGGSIPLIGQDGYSSVKTNSITFNASDFKNGDGSIVKNGNPFSYSNVVVDGDKIVFKTGSSLKRSDTSGEGFYKGGIFYGMSIKGLDVNKPSAKIKHCGSERTWYKVINERGDGEYRGKFNSLEEADKVGYHNISHSWTNNRDDDDPSSMWIEIDNPELGAIEDEFSFTELTFTYDCVRSDSEYSTIMSRNLRDSYKFTNESGEDLPVHVKLGDTLRFKFQTLGTFDKEYDYKVTVSSVRDDENATELTPDDNGIYSLAIANQYNGSASSSYTYLDIKKTEKAATPISTFEELKAMNPSENYYLTNDIEITSTCNLSSYSGYLNGNGHLIYSGFTTLLTDGNPNTDVLFSSFDGVIKNLRVDFTLGFYSSNVSGITYSMNDGLMENVEAKIYYSGLMYGRCGTLAGEMNGGIIRNCSVDFVCYDFDLARSDSFNTGSIVGNLSDGLIKNVNVYIPGEVSTSGIKLIASGDESKLVGCAVSSKEESSSKSPIGGLLNEETYCGMPIYSKDISNGGGGAIFDNVDISNYSKLSFFAKIGNYNKTGNTIGFNGAGTLNLVVTTSSREVWHYIEITNLGNGLYRTRSYPLATASNCAQFPKYLPSYSEMSAASLAELGRFYDWEGDSTAVIYATSLCGELLA